MHFAELEQDIDPDLIAAYLRRHPDFFIDYENLLPDLALPHHTGGQAISLVERQVSVLRARNRDVRSRLSRLLDTARDNEQLFKKTQKLMLSLLEQRDIDGTVDCVLSSLRDDYQVDVSALFLIAQPLLAVSRTRTVSLEQARSAISALLNTSAPTCGHLRVEEMQFLFPAASADVQSAAVVQIVHSHTLLGVLAIGSFDADRYRSNMGVLFLAYIADVLNRVIPRFMHS
jgi:uncharacterized protein YigA (DUF484 family)